MHLLRKEVAIESEIDVKCTKSELHGFGPEKHTNIKEHFQERGFRTYSIPWTPPRGPGGTPTAPGGPPRVSDPTGPKSIMVCVTNDGLGPHTP